MQHVATIGYVIVIAKRQMELPPQGVFVNTGSCYLPGNRWIIKTIGRCYFQMADGIATGSDYFNLSFGVLDRTSSCMCGRWYLPLLLSRDELLTLMNNASFINLLRFWSFLPNMLKFSMVSSGVKMVIYRGGCLEVFFEPLSKCSWGLFTEFLIAFHPVTLVSIDDSTFFLMLSWTSGAIRRFLMDIASFKVNLHLMFPACVLKTFTDSFIVGNHRVWFLDVVARVLLASTGPVCCGPGLDFNFVNCSCSIFTSC